MFMCSWPFWYKFLHICLFLSVSLFPYLPITSLIWTVCPCLVKFITKLVGKPSGPWLCIFRIIFFKNCTKSYNCIISLSFCGIISSGLLKERNVIHKIYRCPCQDWQHFYYYCRCCVGSYHRFHTRVFRPIMIINPLNEKLMRWWI